jgi:hypothetical protein
VDALRHAGDVPTGDAAVDTPGGYGPLTTQAPTDAARRSPVGARATGD